MEILDISISELKLAGYNPRKIKPEELELLATGIKEFGFVQPVIINQDNTIIGGHQRVRAAEMIGLSSVPCLTVDISKDKEKALNIALNKIGGQWDRKLLDDLLLEVMNTTFELTGFDNESLQKVVDRADEKNLRKSIATEAEYTQAKNLMVDIIRQVTAHVKNLAENHPAKMVDAMMIIVNKGIGNNTIFMIDPNTKDVVSELKRYAEAEIHSPLEKLTDATWI